MHEHVSKRVKMHKKATGGTNKHGKHIIVQSGIGKGTHGATWHPKMPPKWLHLNKASWVSDVTTQGQACKGHQTWQSLKLERLTQA